MTVKSEIPEMSKTHSVSTLVNRQFRLAARPVGLPNRNNWTFANEPVRELAEGELLVEAMYLSVDPAMRGWMNEGRSYIEPIAIGAVMRAGGIGRVIASKNAEFQVGEHVTGIMGIQDYCITNGRGFRKVDPKIAPLPVYLGVLGATGLTAYFGLLETGQLKSGETVVVSGAAGAVGIVAAQIAKIKGCRAIGIAGGPAKCKYLVEELGLDAAIDYKTGNVRHELYQHCPKGVDVFFDNVGGDILDDVLAALARGARIVISGAISQYNSTVGVKGPSNYMSLLVNRASMKGMVVFDYADRYPEAIREMAGWMATGKLKAREQIEDGLENFPEIFLKLFKGENTGKLLIKVK